MRTKLMRSIFIIAAVVLLSVPAAGVPGSPLPARAEGVGPIYLPLMVGGLGSVGPPAELTPEEIAEAVDAIRAITTDLLPDPATPLAERDLPGEVTLLGEALLDIPQVAATMVVTTMMTVQAVLSDGLSVMIVNNRPPEASALASESAALVRAATLQSNLQGSVPGSDRAVVTSFDGGASVASEIRSMLQDAGYDVLSLGASLSDMRQYKNLGVLYLDTHGVSWQKVQVVVGSDGQRAMSFGSKVFAYQTSTVMTAADVNTHLADLRASRLAIVLTQDPAGWSATAAITEDFIATHWSFDRGLVMIHSCMGGAGPFRPGGTCDGACYAGDGGGTVLDPTVLRQAVLGAGAETLVTFDNMTNADYARDSILFLFDRLLGADQFRKQQPPLRPFDLAQVRSAMSGEGLLTFLLPTYVNFPWVFGGDVNLVFEGGGDSSGLAPSIRIIDITDDAAKGRGKLELYGDFGPDRGKVTVDSVTATVDSWSRNKIVAWTPFRGPGTAGEAIVKAPDDVESNGVPITEWTGALELTLDPGKGSLEAVADLDLRFRADVHRYRAAIDGTPETRAVRVYLAEASEGRVSARGSYSGEGRTVTWSGGGTMIVHSKAAIDAFAAAGNEQRATGQDTQLSSGGAFGGRISLDPEAGRASLCLTILGTFEQTMSGVGRFAAYIALPLEDLVDRRQGLLACIDTTLGSDYSIPGGSGSWTNEVGEVFRLQWTDFQPVSPPADDTPA